MWKVQLLISLGSAFHWFCFTRTFTNSLETTLTIVALYYWPYEIRALDHNHGKKEDSKPLDQEVSKYGFDLWFVGVDHY